MLSWGGNKVYIIPTHERPDRQIWDLTWWIDVITIRCVLDIHRHMCMLWVPAIFNDAALLSWPWVLLVDTVVPCENHWYAATHEQIVLHKFVFSAPPRPRRELKSLVANGIDCICRCHTTTLLPRHGTLGDIIKPDIVGQ